MGELHLFKIPSTAVILLLTCNVSLLSQNLGLKSSIVHELAKNGFENLIVRIDTESAIVAFENRVYRFDVEALRVVLKLVVPLIKDQKEIILVAQNRQIPIVSLGASISDCKDYFDSKMSGKEFADRLKINSDIDDIYSKLSDEEPENSSSLRSDIAVKPQMTFEFGPKGVPVTSQINVVPELETSWLKGMHFNYEQIVPLINQFETRENLVRPGVVALNQVYRFPGNYFVSASAGIFTQDRYGLDVEAVKYAWNSNLSYGLNLGLSSTLYFSGMTSIFYSDVFSLTGSLHCDYRVPKYDLTLGVMAGKFLMDDKSVRFDVSREFGEFDIGFFAIHAFHGISNGGVNITIPLFPSKYWNPGFVRVRPHEDFTMTYLAKTNPDQLIGLRYNTLNRLEYFNKKLNPDFIRNYFSKN